MNIKLERIWKEAVISSWSIIPEFIWMDWGKPLKTSVTIAGDPARISTKHITNKGLEGCLEINLFLEYSRSWYSFRCSRNVHLSWNPKVHYRVQKFPLLEIILSQYNPLRTFTHCLLEIHLNIILSSSPRLGKSSFIFRFTAWNFLSISNLYRRGTRATYFFFLIRAFQILFAEVCIRGSWLS
jgi:hypothetical protein